MYNPPHPGEFIQATYMEPFNISCRTLANHLDVAASTLNRVIKGQSGISPEMALRLSKALGRSPESWLTMQDNYDLSLAKKQIKLTNVLSLDLSAA
jgi:addiction module HigA family antidote